MWDQSQSGQAAGDWLSIGRPRPWTKVTFLALTKKIEEDVPAGRVREIALNRIEILDPDKTFEDKDKVPDWRTKVEAAAVEPEKYQKALAGELKDLACSRDEDAPYIVLGLMAFSNQRIKDTGRHAPGLVEAILKPDCPVSAALTEADKAALRKLSADEMQELICKSKNNALNILRGFLNDGHIKKTGDQAPSLVEAILKPDCPVSATLTEGDKAALKEIANEASGAH